MLEASWTPPTRGRGPSSPLGSSPHMDEGAGPPAFSATPPSPGDCGSTWAPCSRSWTYIRGALAIGPSRDLPNLQALGFQTAAMAPEPQAPLHRGLQAEPIPQKSWPSSWAPRGTALSPRRWPCDYTVCIPMARGVDSLATWRQPAPLALLAVGPFSNEPGPLEPLFARLEAPLFLTVTRSPPPRLVRPSSLHLVVDDVAAGQLKPSPRRGDPRLHHQHQNMVRQIRQLMSQMLL